MSDYNFWSQYYAPASQILGMDPWQLMSPTETYTAGEIIYPSRFVTLRSDGLLYQSVLGEVPFGVSPEYPNNQLNQPAAVPGSTIQIYTPNSQCWLQYGADIYGGANLTTDNDGQGILTNIYYGSGAIALEAGSAGEIHRVQVIRKPGFGFPTNCEFTCSFTYEFTRCPC